MRDYVLFRALKDLTCVSSACPCDVDAANGWNPTDIFVRTYGKNNKYSKAIAFRMKTDSEPKLTQETGFHKKTSKLTRNFVEYKGFWFHPPPREITASMLGSAQALASSPARSWSRPEKYRHCSVTEGGMSRVQPWAAQRSIRESNVVSGSIHVPGLMARKRDPWRSGGS